MDTLNNPASFLTPLSKLLLGSAAILSLSALSPQAASAAPTTVDQILFLSWDVSGSVSSAEYALQRTGYVNAFNDPVVQNFIASSPNGIAIGLSQWASTDDIVEIPLFRLQTTTDVANFATQLSTLARVTNEGQSTCIGCGMRTAIDTIQATFANPNGFRSNKVVIDVSGDGASNTSPSGCGLGDTGCTLQQKTRAQSLGYTINGLPILGETGLLAYYNTNVVTTDGFTEPANNFNDFDRAVRAKVFRELVVPSPLSGLALAPLFAFIRRQRQRSKSVFKL